MQVSIRINSIKFSDGTTLPISQGDIVVFVGPNNSGKSEALKNIKSLLRANSGQGIVIKELGIQKEGDEEDALSWFNRSFWAKDRNLDTTAYYTIGGNSVNKVFLRIHWNNYLKGISDLTPFFCCHLTTEDRLKAADPAKNIAITKDPLTHPIHYLQKDDKIEKRISAFFQEAFGEELIVHRNAGNEVPLYCGSCPIPVDGQDRISESYLSELEKLPTLRTQGDGMRSFVGILLNTLVLSQSIVLIDEPEAFLHPPQARILGRMLANETPVDRQLFFATHSGDFIRGLLDADLSRIKIIRISREGSINKIHQLFNEDIKKLWNDPLLRYSNILDGLFHEKVVICEGDADCRFYSAINDALCESGNIHKKPHVMFIHCGGKERIALVVKALREIGVPASVIADFDVLSDPVSLRNVVEALGGDWDQVSIYWKIVKIAIESKKPELSSIEAKSSIGKILSELSDSNFPNKAKEDIQNILKRTSPWSQAKEIGKTFIPNGDPSEKYAKLSEMLKGIGLFIVEIGELEQFAKTAGNHGPKWVNEVLKKDLVNDSELRQAREFVAMIMNIPIGA